MKMFLVSFFLNKASYGLRNNFRFSFIVLSFHGTSKYNHSAKSKIGSLFKHPWGLHSRIVQKYSLLKSSWSTLESSWKQFEASLNHPLSMLGSILKPHWNIFKASLKYLEDPSLQPQCHLSSELIEQTSIYLINIKDFHFTKDLTKSVFL